MDRAKTAAEQIATVRGSGASRADNVTWLKSRHAQIDLAGLLPESRHVASCAAQRRRARKESTPLGRIRSEGRVAEFFGANQEEAEGRELASPEGIELYSARKAVVGSTRAAR